MPYVADPWTPNAAVEQLSDEEKDDLLRNIARILFIRRENGVVMINPKKKVTIAMARRIRKAMSSIRPFHHEPYPSPEAWLGGYADPIEENPEPIRGE